MYFARPTGLVRTINVGPAKQYSSLVMLLNGSWTMAILTSSFDVRLMSYKFRFGFIRSNAYS